MEHARLASLTSEYVAGTLSAADSEELYTFLLSSSTAREQFDRLILPHWIANPSLPVYTATGFLEKYVHAPKVVPMASGASDASANMANLFRAAVHSWRTWSVGGALAACVIAALMMALYSTRPMTPFNVPQQLSSGSVATLRHAANVQWLNLTNEILLGQTFGAVDLSATTGVFQLEFTRGARVVVKAPARLQLVSDNEAFLHYGNVTAFVPEEAKGFKITSPMAGVTDLGTEFGLATSPDGRSDVHVFTGVVEMNRPHASSKRMVEGEAVRVRGRRANDMIVDRNAFLFEHDVKALEREEQRSRLAEWRRSARALSLDPGTLIHYTFEGQDEFGDRLSNCVAKPSKGSIASVTGTWTTGRWPEKRGFTFGTPGDRIRFNVPNTITSLTYMAWLRVDSLNSVSNALAITDSGRVGEVHWQIYRDGRVALSSHSASANTGNVDDSWDRGISPTIFSSDRLGKWTHLTSVYDAESRTIRHYLNGEFLSATAIKRYVPLNLGSVGIGNWAGGDRSGARPEFNARHWSGSIDEFALLCRAMRPEEVREYYRRGSVAAGVPLTVAQGR